MAISKAFRTLRTAVTGPPLAGTVLAVALGLQGAPVTAQTEQDAAPQVTTTLLAEIRVPAGSPNDRLASFTWAGGCDDSRVKIWTQVQQSEDDLWLLVPVDKTLVQSEYAAYKGENQVYYIISKGKQDAGCAMKYLSGAYDCGGSAHDRRIQLWHNGDEEGVQWWYVENNGDGTVKFANVYTKNMCAPEKHMYLATDADLATRLDNTLVEGLNFNWRIKQPEAGTQIGKVGGEWSRIALCQGCDGSTYKYKVGVEATKEQEWVKEAKVWAEVAVSQKLKTKSGPVETESEVVGKIGGSTTIGSSVAKSFSVTQGQEEEHKCNKRNFFQWNSSVEQYNVGGVRVAFAKSNVFLCTDDDNPEPLMVQR